MKAIYLLLLATATYALTGCSHDEYVYHDVYHHPVYTHHTGGDTVAGSTTQMQDPGAPKPSRRRQPAVTRTLSHTLRLATHAISRATRMKSPIPYLLLSIAAGVLSGCTTTTHDVRVVHHYSTEPVYYSEPSYRTEPVYYRSGSTSSEGRSPEEDYDVVNQYDRQAR